MEFESDADLFGLTGGMGSGKSTVSTELGVRGAVVVDADLIVRKLQQPDMPIVHAMADLLGAEILDEGNVLNRKRAGELLFADPKKRLALQGMMAPAIYGEMQEQITAAGADALIVLDVPLLIEVGSTALQGIIVVDTPVDLAVERLIQHRGFSEEEARARIATQVSREERRKHADFVIPNDGDLTKLNQEIDKAWQWLQRIRA